ncbi:MAG: dephospho-CoA kinase [Planctomycetes bacterium]|nr:dephospho-CoA kinase [Planctomycetota bacterium]
MNTALTQFGFELSTILMTGTPSQSERPIVIGLVGGVASGKSSVAQAFAKHGAVVIDADLVGHEALNDPANLEAIISAFGQKILLDDGTINRKGLGSLVFQDAAKLKVLTDITHPWIRSTIRSRLDAYLSQGNFPAIILDVSLLLESGNYEEDLDFVVFVDGKLDERQRRAVEKRGWEEGELSRREANQLPLDVKRQRANAIIDNSGTPEAMQEAVDLLWQKWFSQRT